MAPEKVTLENSPEVWNALYGRMITKPKKPRLKVGDRVRLNKKFRPFKKSLFTGMDGRRFVVRKVSTESIPVYKLEEWDGTHLEGTRFAKSQRHG